jgi:hypothetical protein
MKKYILLLYLFCNQVFILKAQDKVLKSIPSYLDYATIKGYEDSLSKKQVDTFITLLINTNPDYINMKPNDISYFIWIKGGLMNIIRITDSTISEPQRIKSFVKLSNVQSLAIKEHENKLRFVAPLDGTEGDVVIIKLRGKSFLIEYGDNATFQPLDKNKNNSRQNFIEAIKAYLKPLSDKWIYNKSYNRGENI